MSGRAVGISLLLFGVFTGLLRYETSSRAQLRRLRSMRQLLALMEGDLEKSRCTMAELLESIRPGLRDDALLFSVMLSGRLDELGKRRFFELWSDCVTDALPEATQEERRCLDELGHILGQYELETQCQALRRSRAMLEAWIGQTEASLPQRRHLALGLSISAAALCVLVLI